MSYAVMAEVARRRLGRAVEASAELHKAEIAQAFGILRYPWVMRHDDHMDAYSLAWKAASQLRMLDSGYLTGAAALGRPHERMTNWVCHADVSSALQSKKATQANIAKSMVLPGFAPYYDPYEDYMELFGSRAKKGR